MSILDILDAEDSLRPPHLPLQLRSDASFELVFKIQETCNINCSYCYMYNVGNKLHTEVPARASLETCRKVGEMLASEASERNPRRVSLILHGGEPMLMKTTEFEARLKVIESVLRERLTVEQRSRIFFSLQTNATLVSDAWIALLGRWAIRVGVSIDGPAHVHDDRRLDKRGRGTHAAVVRGISKLDAAQKSGAIPPIGALCVINPDADGAEVYSYIAGELGINNFDFLLPFMNWDTYNEETVAKTGRFLSGAFDAWVADLGKRPRVHVRVFNTVLSSLTRSRGRYREGIPLGHQVVVVESDGSILPEESLRPTYSRRFSTLTVHENTAHQVLNDPRFYAALSGSWTRAQECDGCALIDSCASGHSAGRVGMRYSSETLFRRKFVYCAAFIDLYVRAAALLIRRGRRLSSLVLSPEQSEDLQLGPA